MPQKPLVTCAYGWGRIFMLYQEFVDVDGTMYSLHDLVHVRSRYRRVLNIPSVRLELQFKEKNVVLRGIAAIDDAAKIVEYLNTYRVEAGHISLPWSRLPRSSLLETSSSCPTPSDERSSRLSPGNSRLPHTQMNPTPSFDRSIQELAEASTTPIAIPQWLRELERDVQHTQKRQSALAKHSQNHYGFDVEQLAQDLQADTLPSVAVPLHLPHAEHAHYSIEASLCGEPVGNIARYTYPARDHGTLILTNKRLVYIGRKSQLVLDYARLVHVARLYEAIAFSIDHRSQRQVFKMSRPLECAMYLDSILRHFHAERLAEMEVQVSQIPTQRLSARETYAAYSARTSFMTNPRQVAHMRHTTGMRSIKPPSTIADIDTIPLSADRHTELLEEDWIR